MRFFKWIIEDWESILYGLCVGLAVYCLLELSTDMQSTRAILKILGIK